MSARSAGILLALMLLAPAANAGWFGGDGYKKKLPKAISMVEIRRHDTARLRKPSKVFSRFDSHIGDPSWGGSGPRFLRSVRLQVSHQHAY